MRFIVISEKDEVLRISHAVMSELFDRKLALPQFAQKRIRWCEVVVSLKEGHAVAVQRVLARYIHFDAQVSRRAQHHKLALGFEPTANILKDKDITICGKFLKPCHPWRDQVRDTIGAAKQKQRKPFVGIFWNVYFRVEV
jgi:hypothetical protein